MPNNLDKYKNLTLEWKHPGGCGRELAKDYSCCLEFVTFVASSPAKRSQTPQKNEGTNQIKGSQQKLSDLGSEARQTLVCSSLPASLPLCDAGERVIIYW